MPAEAIMGLLVPFLGTTLGAACVFVMRGSLSALLERSLAGFAAGASSAQCSTSALAAASSASPEARAKLPCAHENVMINAIAPLTHRFIAILRNYA